jgi:ABC-2 type transport system ATP-binding protein
MAIISQGQLLLEGKPSEALANLQGKVWKKIVATDAEREALEKSMNVISTHLVGGLHEVRVYAETSPGSGFESADADLEDVYFLNLGSAERN